MKKNISDIEAFLKLKTFAIIGVSSKKKKFGNGIFQHMLKRGMHVYPINRDAMLIEGQPCYPDIANLPSKPSGIVLCIHPKDTELAVKEIAAVGIKNVWMQQGSESPKAIEYCKSHGIKAISGNCLLMFLEKPGFPHNLHHWIWGMGKKEQPLAKI